MLTAAQKWNNSDINNLQLLDYLRDFREMLILTGFQKYLAVSRSFKDGSTKPI